MELMVFGSCFNATAWIAPSLMLAPQAVTVKLTAKFFRLIAAFKSRSISVPQSHLNIRADSGKDSLTDPHTEHVLLDG